MQVENMDKNLETIKYHFAKTFIEAISSKSIEACAELLQSFDDQIYLTGATAELDMSKEEYNTLLRKRTKEFLDEISDFIDKKNENADSALTIEHFTEINTYDFEIKEEPFQVINTISINMNTRLVDEVNYQVGFQIENALLIQNKIKISNWYFVKRYESVWDEINEKNTPYLKANKEKVRTLMADHLDEEYSLILNDWNNWYYHEGDLELEKFDLKVNFIVTGNLTIRENLVEIDRELIVLGKTNLNALYLDEDNNVLFLGGIEFKTGVFILSSGAFQVLKQPKGPFLYTYSESNDIENINNVNCFIDAAMGEAQGACHELLSEKFIEEGTDVYDLDMDTIVEALRNGENIFK